jgi:hypothetical protein
MPEISWEQISYLKHKLIDKKTAVSDMIILFDSDRIYPKKRVMQTLASLNQNLQDFADKIDEIININEVNNE